MEQYINKSAVVAEIEKLRMYHGRVFNEYDAGFSEGRCSAFDEVLSFLNTLEVKDIDEITKTAEDHAYFAGSENTREKLIDEACDKLRIKLANFEDYIGMKEKFIEDFKTYLKG